MEIKNTRIPLIKIENLTYKYPDGTLALDNVSAEIFKGETIAILGPNGAGKTTLLLAIAGVLGKNLPIKLNFLQNDLEDKDNVFSNIGFLFQNPEDQLFCLTVEEEIAFGLMNLGFSKTQIKNKIDQIYRMLKIDISPDKEITKLSFGQKRKVALASILVYEPPLLLLDEPTFGLDPKSVDELITILFNLKNENKTILFSTNDLDFANDVANKALVLTSEHKVGIFEDVKEVLLNKEFLYTNNLIRKKDLNMDI